LPLHLTAAALVVVILGPLARAGYVLNYDMVFVPRQRLSWSLVAPADALPRAVPVDAVVALFNLVLPGAVLERIAVAGLVYAAALGAARLVPTDRTPPRIVAAVGYVWSAYLAERLLLGQWVLLCCYAALPWIVSACIDINRGRRSGLAALVLAAAAASLSPTGGLIATATTATLLIGGRATRTSWSAVLAVAALNTPWIAASLATSAGGQSDPAGVAAFAARSENWAGVVGALLGTGGAWNRLTTPDSRAWTVTPAVTILVVAAAAVGWPVLRRRLPSGLVARLTWLAGGSFVLAIAGATVPGAVALRFLIGHVPGGGLLRDGQKFLIPYALLLVLAVACGVEWLAGQLGTEAGGVVLVAAVLLPVLAMPDLAWGGAGALRPVAYPEDWAVVDRLISAAPGEVLALPFAEYRRYGWNGGRVVIDPLPRYLSAPVLSDDTLVVDGTPIAGEDRRAAQVQAHLAAGAAAADLGVAWVVVEGTGVPASALAGLETVYSGPDLTLYRNPSPGPPARTGTSARVAAALAYAVPLGLVLTAAGSCAGAWWRRRRRT
jgi:hypothetical protein